MNIQVKINGGASKANVPAVTPSEVGSMTLADIEKVFSDIKEYGLAWESTVAQAVQTIEAALKAKEQNIETEVLAWEDQFRQDHGISPGVAAIGLLFGSVVVVELSALVWHLLF